MTTSGISLSVGKWRGLQRCSTVRGTVAVLALDHRNNLRRVLRPEAPEEVAPDELSEFKQQVVGGLASAATAVLLDPEVGAAQTVVAGRIPPQTGLVVAVEATGYQGEPNARRSRILEGWSVRKARRMGADAVKLLVYYHPDSPTAGETESLVRAVAEDCSSHDLLLMLEPLSYSLNERLSGLEFRRVVVETARRLTVPGVDLLKAEFPIDIASEENELAWAEACRDLTEASAVPWVILSAGVGFETYLRQVVVGCQSGASGVAAGRAVWKEAVGLSGAARKDFLHGEARSRMARLTAACESLGHPVWEFFRAPRIDSTWYRDYGDN